VTVPNGDVRFGVLLSAAKLYLAIGDIVRVSGWMGLGGTALPANVTVDRKLALGIFSADGTILGWIGVSTNVLAGYAFFQAALQIPATLSGGTPAYGQFSLHETLTNSSGANFLTGTGNNYGFANYDDVKCVIQNTAFDLTPLNTSGTFTGASPLSQVGVTTAINIAASTMQFGDGQISFNSGSVNPGSMGTWYIYADDPTYSGGAVTYAFTNSQSATYAGNGRIYFGKITTSGGGGGAGAGGGSGGGRLQL
jgi:hypothetical protein